MGSDQSNADRCAKPTRPHAHQPRFPSPHHRHFSTRSSPHACTATTLHICPTSRTPSIPAPTCCAYRVLDLGPSSLRTSQGRWWQRWATLHRTARPSATISGVGFRSSTRVVYLVSAVDAAHTKSRLLQSLGGWVPLSQGGSCEFSVLLG